MEGWFFHSTGAVCLADAVRFFLVSVDGIPPQAEEVFLYLNRFLLLQRSMKRLGLPGS
ncbi:hypothetical protein HMPREF3038_02113 [Akkermansia sp. KLE1797]|nr:hypothetical protein HMPREF3038_02113 [Akkermansia sp. KLE1797]KXU53554.1 hypothetical protein HMPREF3039_02276 [Akkermansia sp. KLE1798]